MKILHTEASPGWGGQELRILNEAEGMRNRGHQIIFAVQQGGGLVKPAREKGFTLYEVPFKKSKGLQILLFLMRLIRKEGIEIINTHSSLDAWIGGLAGKLSGCHVIRTRHLSTPIRKGFNSYLLYNWLADHVVTTCEETSEAIRNQAKLSHNRCLSIPTGVDPAKMSCNEKSIAEFRKSYGIEPDDCLVGTLCVLRGWKGVSDFLQAAKLLENHSRIKWMVVGSGVSEAQFVHERKSLGLEDRVIFTGHLSFPFTALAAMDLFLLLSWANEGVSQASLQAAWFQKPLITTSVGGLKEVCLENLTGFLVPKHDPQAVAKAVLKLADSPTLRKEMGERAQSLVKEKFTLDHMLDHMEALYRRGN